MEYIIIILLLALVGLGVYCYRLSREPSEDFHLAQRLGEVNEKLKKAAEDLAHWEKEARDNFVALEAERERNNKVVSQKMSNLVRTGAILENVVPIIPSLPYDAKNMHHLGMPIDFIYFDYDGAEGPEVVFIEVKSGNARESKRQKLIKKAIQQGKVYYELLTINDKEIKTKRVKNHE